MKVDLRDERPTRSGTPTGRLVRCAPFVMVPSTLRVHRVRSGQLYSHRDPAPWQEAYHVAVSCWCGQSGFLSSTTARRAWVLCHDIPDAGFACGTCEGRAVGAGELPGAVIVKHPLIFSPRERARMPEPGRAPQVYSSLEGLRFEGAEEPLDLGPYGE